MIYLRVFLKSGGRVYLKVDAGDLADATRIAKRKTRGFAEAEPITRQDYEVGLLEMDIVKADRAAGEGNGTGLFDLQGQPPSKPAASSISWMNVGAGLLAFVLGIALMIFWSVRDLDSRRSMIILILSGLLLLMGLAYFLVGLMAKRD